MSACRFPPHGTRSWGIRTGLLIGNEEPRELERFGCFVMIETVRGLDDIDAIAAVDGLTGIFVGPADLAISLGMSTDPGVWSDEQRARHVAATDRVRDACKRAGIVPRILVGNPARARGYIETGFQAVTASLDVVVMESGSVRDLAIARGKRRRRSVAYENPFLAPLAAGRSSIGSWLSTAEPVWAEVIARTGYDHVLVDLQHGSTELSTLACSRRSRWAAVPGSSASRSTTPRRSARCSTSVRSRWSRSSRAQRERLRPSPPVVTARGSSLGGAASPEPRHGLRRARRLGTGGLHRDGRDGGRPGERRRDREGRGARWDLSGRAT